MATVASGCWAGRLPGGWVRFVGDCGCVVAGRAVPRGVPPAVGRVRVECGWSRRSPRPWVRGWVGVVGRCVSPSQGGHTALGWYRVRVLRDRSYATGIRRTGPRPLPPEGKRGHIVAGGEWSRRLLLFRGAGLYRFAAPPRGRDQPRRTRNRDTTCHPPPPGGGLGAQPPSYGKGRAWGKKTLPPPTRTPDTTATPRSPAAPCRTSYGPRPGRTPAPPPGGGRPRSPGRRTGAPARATPAPRRTRRRSGTTPGVRARG